MLALEQKLESLLFYKGEPERRSTLAALLEVSLEELDTTARLLSASLAERGIRLLAVDDELELVTAPEASEVILRLRKNELTKDLGKAGAETLAIILYSGPLSRTQVDHIRGVNSTFIIRNLEVRGLIERVINPANARQSLLRATPDLLKHLGVTSVDELPDRGSIRASLAAFEERNDPAEPKRERDAELHAS